MCFHCESTAYVGIKSPDKKPKFVADEEYRKRNEEGV
jgi:hypothetical protein